MSFVKVNLHHIQKFKDIVGAQYVLDQASDKVYYESDQTLNFTFPCVAVVKPKTAEEVAAIIKICNQDHIPVTPRGGGTGVTGGALPLHQGIVISLERLNNIIEINVLDRQVTVEAGVITQMLQEKLLEKGLSFPVNPGSKGSSFIGGNVATSAGGTRSGKYGTVKDYVINLEVVLPTGEIIWTGANVSKNVSGFNLSALFVGSEGTLGMITKIVLKLIPAPKAEIVLLAPFNTKKMAFKAMKTLILAGITPTSIELVCDNALKITGDYLEGNFPLLTDSIKAHLLIEFDGSNQETVFTLGEQSSVLIEEYTCDDILIGTSFKEREKLWKLRHSIGDAMTQHGQIYRDIDICIPRSKVLKFMEKVDQISLEHELRTICFGHIMDGNIHTMILIKDHEITYRQSSYYDNEGISEIYRLASALGGVVSGEHGIGILQKSHLLNTLGAQKLALMKDIKKIVDPNYIMNPGKIFDTIH